MKKLITVLCAVGMFGVTVPAFALFTNGGFEAGDLSGWTVQYGYHYNGAQGFTGAWSYQQSAGVVTAATATDSYHYPYIPTIYNDHYMAILNDAYGMYNATRISQTDTVTAADIATGGVISVNWGTVLDDPQHDAANQPFFGINVLKNGAQIGTFSANASAHATPGSGWSNVGNYAYTGDGLWYKAGQFQFAMTNFALNDQVTVELSVFDCGYSGHGGYAFLDGIQAGTPPPPPPGTVPEPSTLVLLGIGFAGIGFMRKRMHK